MSTTIQRHSQHCTNDTERLKPRTKEIKRKTHPTQKPIYGYSENYKLPLYTTTA